MNETNLASGVVGIGDDSKLISSTKEVAKSDSVVSNPNPASPTPTFKDSSNTSKSETKSNSHKTSSGKEEYYPPTPNPYEYRVAQQSHGYPVNITPQAGSAYQYLSYGQHHMTPEPPSPATHHAVSDMYNVNSFFHQSQAGAFAAPQQPSSFGIPGSGGNNNTSSTHNNVQMSPPRGIMPSVAVSMTGGIPPASPLFPRATTGAGSLEAGNQQRGAPPSPNIPYIMSPQQLGAGSNSMYQAYPVTGVGSRSSDDGTWGGGGDR